MSGITQIRLSGFGGQGVVLAGVLLGHAGVRDGRRVAGSNSYGAQARGSACKAEVILADRLVDFPHVLEADVLVAMSQGAYDRFIGETKPSGLVIYDSQLTKPTAVSISHKPVPATEVAVREIGNKQVANIVMLGALTTLSHVVSGKSMEAAVSAHVPPRFKEINLKALRRGLELGKTSG
jgi:2-oxoglutarate ferredoxin oxidoreductase subunit gamma